jgi:hypothetical protein
MNNGEISVVPISSQPGIKRDGTMLEGNVYVDGQWVRFERGLPRKIDGYRAINRFLDGPVRALIDYTQDQLTYVHSGSAQKVERFTIDGLFNTSILTDRTPTSLAPSDQNLWQFDIAAKLEGGVLRNLLIAQVAPNLDCICNSLGGQIFYGDLTGTAPLTEITLPTGGDASGGIVALHPYLFYFGKDGMIGWSVPGDPTDLSGTGSGTIQSAAGQKIVCAIPLRGGPGNAPSGLFWAANALIRASFVGGNQVFQFDTISTQTSILSSRSPIEYDGVFYWIGVDRFLMFNGVVRDVPNDYNRDWFFNNLNFEQRQKVFSVKVPRYGEIWWCFPSGQSLEPDRAIIYNVRLNIWYDTVLPNNGRSAGVSPTVFPKPLMTGALANTTEYQARVTENSETRITEEGDVRVTEESDVSTYKLWIHEVGVDEVDGQRVHPILSYFETADMTLPLSGTPTNNAISILMLEPDFVQSGEMSVQVKGRQNARAPEIDGVEMFFPPQAQTVNEQVVFLKTQRRQMRLLFKSNTLGGFYQMGAPLVHVTKGDGTTLG